MRPVPLLAALAISSGLIQSFAPPVGAESIAPAPGSRATAAGLARFTGEKASTVLAGARVVGTTMHTSVMRGVVHTAMGDIETTPEHPFYNVGLGWVRASSLRPGDVLQGPSGRTLILAPTAVDETAARPVFNLTVERLHSYFVGKNPVLVHNTCSRKLQNQLRSTPADGPARIPVNDTGRATNCSECTVAALLGGTVSQVVAKTGVQEMERGRHTDQISKLFRAAGLSDGQFTRIRGSGARYGGLDVPRRVKETLESPEFRGIDGFGISAAGHISGHIFTAVRDDTGKIRFLDFQSHPTTEYLDIKGDWVQAVVYPVTKRSVLGNPNVAEALRSSIKENAYEPLSVVSDDEQIASYRRVAARVPREPTGDDGALLRNDPVAFREKKIAPKFLPWLREEAQFQKSLLRDAARAQRTRAATQWWDKLAGFSGGAARPDAALDALLRFENEQRLQAEAAARRIRAIRRKMEESKYERAHY